MKGGIYWYVAPVNPAEAEALLVDLDAAGLNLAHPVTDQPSYLSASPGCEGDAVFVDLSDLAKLIADAACGSGDPPSFQLWLNGATSTDVICTVYYVRDGLSCLGFSFDGLIQAESQTVEDAVLTVRRSAATATKLWLVDCVGLDSVPLLPQGR